MKTKVSISTTPLMQQFNATVENADFYLAMASTYTNEPETTDPFLLSDRVRKQARIEPSGAVALIGFRIADCLESLALQIGYDRK